MLYIYVNISPIPPLLFDISCFLDFCGTQLASRQAKMASRKLPPHECSWRISSMAVLVDFPQVFPWFFHRVLLEIPENQ